MLLISFALFRRRLLCWYDQHARQFSWRGVADPYHVWVSEIMLQQTTTQTVQGYFDRFIEAFPTIPSLAEADLDTVNRYWEGLGYYRRCALLHKAAREIMVRYGSIFPKKYEDVCRLPGIGRYTAGAILSIAFDQRLPILEANTLRLHARLLAERRDAKSQEVQALLWSFAESVLPRVGSGKVNQALMDLGSLVCTPKLPKCAECPVVAFCESAKQSLQKEIPYLPKKTVKEDRTEVALLVQRGKKILVVRSPEGERWAGLWDFPRTESSEKAHPTLMPSIVMRDPNVHIKLAQRTGHCLLPLRFITSLKHSVTKYRITLYFCKGRDNGLTREKPLCEVRWVTLAELQELPLNSTARKLVKTVLEW